MQLGGHGPALTYIEYIPRFAEPILGLPWYGIASVYGAMLGHTETGKGRGRGRKTGRGRGRGKGGGRERERGWGGLPVMVLRHQSGGSE